MIFMLQNCLTSKSFRFTLVIYVRVNPKMNIATPELHPVPVVSPWYHLGIDFLGPFHTPSKQENCYILTIADYFSKFVQAIPCRTKEACYISEVLFKVCGQ